nr:fructose-bisphosphate aldolase [Sulfuriferula thiophila]
MPLSRLLAAQGIVPGIKVDKGTKALTNFPGDKFTEGQDGLAERLAGYQEMGARFASVTEEVLEMVFHTLHRHRVVLECMLLKPNMVLPGAVGAIFHIHGILIIMDGDRG